MNFPAPARLLLALAAVWIGLRLRFDNHAKLPRVTCPTLFLHSTQDDIVPYAQARLNFAAAGGRKTFVDLKGSHNEGFLNSQPLYGKAIQKFLASTK